MYRSRGAGDIKRGSISAGIARYQHQHHGHQNSAWLNGVAKASARKYQQQHRELENQHRVT